jgi:2'-hydroxyisoflavone reductase
MRILMIGGTVFLGRHLVEAALERGHEVTLFNRGQHNPELFPETEKLRGNRDGDLAALDGRTWDAVIDTCGYYPRIVRQSAERLSSLAGHYTFISSISVYASFRQPRVSEDSPLGHIDHTEAESADTITNENYGPLKVRCEEEVERAFSGRALLVRPGLIVGPHDPSDRFTYWPARVARGGEMLVPGPADQRMEIIDVRDLAEWNILIIEEGKTGAYNATGPDYPLTMGMVLDKSRELTGSDARPTYVEGAWLKAQGVDPEALNTWYLDPNEPEWRYAWDVDCSKAQRDGLTYRPLAQTISDTLAWNAARLADAPRRTDLDPVREKELLDRWRKRSEQ